MRFTESLLLWNRIGLTLHRVSRAQPAEMKPVWMMTSKAAVILAHLRDSFTRSLDARRIRTMLDPHARASMERKDASPTDPPRDRWIDVAGGRREGCGREQSGSLLHLREEVAQVVGDHSLR